ncbi:MAG: sulfatase-like hydrolase/transferase [Bryobacteraceae bacterium]|nr:sulfatase-like hydrolase/transferase [Bryobacteraceae bacterium]
MDRRTFVSSLAAAPLAAQETRLNVVLIMTDDMGAGDLGCYGVRDIKTPNIDKIARQGVRFTESYSNGPVCTPTRCGLMTGRYQQRYGLEWALNASQREHPGLPPSVPTLPRLFKNAGYRTAMFGKWHLGSRTPEMPLAHGFDEYFGITGGNTDLYTGKDVNGTLDLYEGNEKVEAKGYLTELFSQRAAKFVESQSAAAPFFLYVPYNSVHWPFQAPGRPHDIRTRATWYDGTRRDYAEMLQSIDQGVGSILDAVERKGFGRNTLVMFTNDNGGERLSRNWPFASHKGTLWEGGIRVPSLAKLPGRIPAGKDCAQPMMSMDLAVTALKAAGVQAPDNVDGIDLMPAMRGGPVTERTQFWRINRADRKQRAARKGDWKWLDDGPPFQALFNVKDDPGERSTKFYEYPEKVAELRGLYEAWERDLAKNPPPYFVR